MIRALVRSQGRLLHLESVPVTASHGTLEDPQSLHNLMQSVDAVVHCAGAVAGDKAHLQRTNREGTARLITVANACAVPRLIVLSSLAARYPHLSPYAESKYWAEQEVPSFKGEALVLRPPAVYGPGDWALQPLFRLMALGIVPQLGGRHARFSLLYVDDLADAVLCGLTSSATGCFELHDGHPQGYRWADLATTVAILRGRPVFSVPIPATALRILALTQQAASFVTRRPTLLSLGKISELRHPDWVCDNAAITAATGWVPQTSLADGLRLTYGWGNK